MADPPEIRIQRHYESPPNVEAEVPGTHQIREPDYESHCENSFDPNSSEIEIKEAEFTLSPVITVTQNETTLSKESMKKQKVVVTEDISVEEFKNGEHRTIGEVDSLTQKDKQPGSPTNERRDKRKRETKMDGEEKGTDEKKSKIPIMRLRQVVERVKREREAQKEREKPRRSSIPKLKDAKKVVKRDTSLKIEPKVEDEFEKIYEEIVDSKQKEPNDKILSLVSIEDTEKIESKFEELMHSYDEEEHEEKPTVARISKIPALRRKEDDRSSRLSALIDRTRDKNAVTETQLKDGGFKVTASTITTKRFLRSSSGDLTKEQKVVTEIIDIKESGDDEVFEKETVQKVPSKPERSLRKCSKRISRDGSNGEIVEPIEKTQYNENEEIVREIIVIGNSTKEGTPVTNKKITRVISREITSGDQNIGLNKKLENEHTGINKDNPGMETLKNVKQSGNTPIVAVEEFENGDSLAITTKTIITENVKVSTPVITEKNVRKVSVNKDDSKRETATSEETRDGGNTKNTKKAEARENVKGGIPVRTERFTRGISREMGNIKIRDTEIPVRTAYGNQGVTKASQIDDNNNGEVRSDDTKIPTFTKVTHRFSKGRIQSVEISRTIEWKPDEIETKNFSRSVSEKVTKKELKDTGNWSLEAQTAISEITNIDKPKAQSDTEDATMYQDETPNHPILESKIKDTAKDVARKIDIRKVTELQSEKQVTNIEKNTFTLSKTIDLTVERDSREPREISIQTSLIESKDLKANDIKQISNEGSSQINEESIITDIVTEKKVTSPSNFSTQEKDSYTREVTILKGNVNRLKDKIGRENEVVSKKEIDEELPKEKLVLAKIAIFEHVEPKEPYPVIKPLNIKKCKYLSPYDTIKTPNNTPVVFSEELKEQPNFESFGETNKVELSSNYNEVTCTPRYINTPVIVKEFWKTEEGTGENVSTINRMVTENTMATQSQENARSFDQNGQIEFTTTLPAPILFESEVATILPATIGVDSEQLIDNDVEKITNDPNKIQTNNKFDYETSIGKSRPGKINLNRWKSQVESDKNQIELPKILQKNKDYTKPNYIGANKPKPGKINFSLWKNQIETNKITTKKTKDVETAKAFPGKVDFKSHDEHVEVSKILHPKINLNTIENTAKHSPIGSQVEQASIFPGKKYLSYNESQVEEIKLLQSKIEFTATSTQVAEVGTLPSKIYFVTEVNQAEVHRAVPGRIEIETYESQAVVSESTPDNIYYSSTENQAEVTSSLQSKIDFETGEGKFNVETPLEYKPYFKAWQNQVEANKSIVGKTDVVQSGDLDTNSAEIANEIDPRELLKSPELVDEDPVIEVKDNKNLMISRIKSKMYFITNKNSIQNATNKPLTAEVAVVNENDIVTDCNKNVSAEEYEPNFNTYTTKINPFPEYNSKQFDKHEIEPNENVFNFDTRKVENELSRSAPGADDLKSPREDLKRAKSLAELDLGDTIQGTVRRIIGRINSVEYERRESVKEKISIKEMPKKMSVFEKIALFEGKAATTKMEFTTSKPRTTLQNMTQEIPKAVYLQEIEALNNAKTNYGRLEDMIYMKLSNDVEMPVIALGSALVDNRLLPHVVAAAIDLGYRAIDTAYIYGNEREIGQAIKAKIDDGTVKREDLFISSKLWSTFHRTDLVEEACRNSLRNLGLDYFDLFMIHNPVSFKEGPEPVPKIATVLQYSEHDFMDAWYGMENLVAKGLVKSIGVSNFNSQQIQKILDKGRIKPVVNQVECHPYLSQQRLDNFCAERNITLSCYGVLGSKGTPADYKSVTATPVIDDALVKVMASGLGVSPAQLLIRYQIDCGHSVVVKASSAAHLWDNLQALTFKLEKSQIDGLSALNRNRRNFDFKGMGDTHRNYPFLEPY